MYNFVFLLFMFFSPLLFAGDNIPDEEFPYFELQNKIFQYHIKFNIERWESENIFDSFISKIDPYKIIFSKDSLSDVSSLRSNFNNLLIDEKVRTKILKPLFDFYIQENNNFLKTIKTIISDIELAQLHTSTDLFDVSPKLYTDNENSRQSRVQSFILSLIIDDIINNKDFKEIKKDLLNEYIKIPKMIDYREFNFLLLETLSNQMDPHSSYLSPIEQSQFNLEFSGVLKAGVGIRFSYDKLGQPLIEDIVEGGPAHKEGKLKKGDVLTGYSDDGENFKPFSGLSENNILRAFVGEIGEKIYISYIRNSTTSISEMYRESVDFKKDRGDRLEYKTLIDGDLNYGYIKIPLFYDNFLDNEESLDVSKDVENIIKEHSKSIDGLIIDLRNNGGGSLNAALRLLDIFISDDVLLQVSNYNGKPKILKSENDTRIFTKPLIVYINGFSASASEIFAGTIQDYGRGVIIGMPTHGKGTIQSVINLPLGQLKITTSKFFLPSGKSTQEKGVTPDILLPIQFPQDLFGERSIKNHIEYSEVDNIISKNDMQITLNSIIKEANDFHKSHGFKYLRKYYNLANTFKHSNAKIPLNIELRKEELTHYYNNQLTNLNMFYKSNKKPLIKDKEELLSGEYSVDISSYFHDTAFFTLRKMQL